MKMNVLEIIIRSAATAITAAGFFFGIRQWKKGLAGKRSEYIYSLIEKVRSDEDIREAYYLIEYNNDWYDEHFHENKSLEPKMDKMLTYFSYVCYLYKVKEISDDEFSFFKYNIEWILMNSGVINYLYNLYHFSKSMGIKNFSFKYLLEYGKAHDLVDDDFYNRESYKSNQKYSGFLNF